MHGNITHSPPIAPALKAYMDKALPANQGGHVLALAEDHTQTANKTFLSDHLAELADPNQHNVGLIAKETNIFMNVFLWAYRDGTLNPPNGMDEKTYLREMFRFYSNHHLSQASVEVANLAIKAIDEEDSVQFQCFDTRDCFKDDLKFYANQLQSPELANMVHPDATTDLDMRFAFMLREIQKLLDENPEYQRRLDNLDAVISAQREWNKYHADAISNDALSAAVVKAMLPEDEDGKPKNVITISGLHHITGVHNSLTKLDGTFAQHLARNQFYGSRTFLRGLQTSTALAGSGSEIRCSLTEMDFFHTLARQFHPFHFPDILDVQTGEVIRDNVEEAAPDSVTATLIKERNAYNLKNRSLKDDRYPTAANHREIGGSTRGIQQCKPLQEALARVHKDYQTMYAAEREKSQSVQR